MKINQYRPIHVTDADMEFIKFRLMNKKKMQAIFSPRPIPAKYFDTNYAAAKACK